MWHHPGFPLVDLSLARRYPQKQTSHCILSLLNLPDTRTGKSPKAYVLTCKSTGMGTDNALIVYLIYENHMKIIRRINMKLTALATSLVLAGLSHSAMATVAADELSWCFCPFFNPTVPPAGK